MRRREFISVLGSAAAWVAVCAQQGERMRRIGILAGLPENRRGSRRSYNALMSWVGPEG